MKRVPAVLPLAVAAVFAGAALALVDGVRERGDLSAFDPAVTGAVVAERSPALTAVAEAFTFVGSTPSLAVATLATVAWIAWRRRDLRSAVVVAVAMAASSALTIVLKTLIARSRPPAGLALGTAESSFAFPSGHTLNSTVFFGLLAGLVLIRTRHAWGRVAVVTAWIGASAAVGLSRLYLGFHWMTDVLGGWSVAVTVLALTATIALLVRDHGLRPPARTRPAIV
jgi:undecaprenyl-diphosphatase